jgi:hypothetical protein
MCSTRHDLKPVPWHVTSSKSVLLTFKSLLMSRLLLGFSSDQFQRFSKQNLVCVSWMYHLICVKLTLLWDVAPCSLIGIYRRFRGAFCLYRQGYEWMWDETSVSFYETTQRNTLPTDVRTWNGTYELCPENLCIGLHTVANAGSLGKSEV